MNPLKKLAGQTLVYGMGTIVPRLLNYFLLTPFYTRIFITGEYGVITELYAYMAFLLVLLTYGMETAFFRFAGKEPDPKKVFSTSLVSLFVTSVLFVFLVVIFSQPVATLIEYGNNPEYITMFSVIVALDAFTAIPFAYLRHRNKALRFSIIKIVNVLVNIGLNFFFLWLAPKMLSANPGSWVRLVYDPAIGVGYAFIANLASSGLTLLLLLPDIFSVRPAVDKDLLKRMLTYAFPLLIVGLAGMVNEVADKIIFKFLLIVPPGEADPKAYAMSELGVYGAAYKLSVLMTLFIQMFRYAAEPFFFAQKKEENAKKIYADVMKYFVIFCLIIFLGVTLFADIVKYFIGPDYREGLFILPIVLMANLLLGITFNLSIWYKLNDMTRFGAYIGLSGAAMTILMNVLLVPRLSYLGAAIGHLSAYSLMVILSYYWGQKYYRIGYPMKRIGFYTILTLALFLPGYYLPVGNQALSLAINAVLFCIFLAVVYFKERREIRGL
ncbi:MAG TPA: oligosaccharide flippase family protein [Bacteroidales bacterium]|nr:oligosaccharide flippase family protein [Bacteroidales bacterium]HPI86070.1 oligosaccharide flippase family protein [Bacteroidales bacterium]